MSEIIFAYKGKSIHIQAQPNETLNMAIDRFCAKNNVNRKKVYFIYNGEKLNENLTIDKIMKIECDTHRKNNNLKIAENIICPKCHENIFMEIDNYKINLKNCINRHNKTISIKEFEDTQLIDSSKIICNNCKIKNMGNTVNNMFYKCLNCKIDICPVCKSNHNKEHKIINYFDISNICDKHYDNYENYCINCNKNICLKCFENHNNHNIENFEKLYIS